MTQNLLEQTDEDLVTLDENKDYLAELVGPDKKFKSEEDLAKGKYLADSYIQVLEKRLDAITEDYKKAREENMAGPKLQELLDKLEATQKQLTSREPPVSNEDTKAAFKPEDVESLVSSSILKHEQTRKEQENYATVRAKLEEQFGHSYKDVLKKKSNQLGLSDDEVNSMARKNPNLFIKTFDLNEPVDNKFQAPPRTNLRSDNFAQKAKSENHTWSYYEDLRKKDPMAWLDKKIAVQMEKDAQALGRDFYDI